MAEQLDEGNQLEVSDLDDSAEVFDPQLSWDAGRRRRAVRGRDQTALSGSGAARSFAAGSLVCCDEATGTSLSPAKVLANNSGSGVPGDPEQFGYCWRVRAVDPDGNAGEWNYGRPFDKTCPAVDRGSPPARQSRRHRRRISIPVRRSSTPSSPAIVWRPVPGASSYEVQVVPYVQIPGTSSFVCNWSSATSDTWTS